MTSDIPSTRAGEYVLGTLAGAECEAFRAALATDPQLQAEVREWERRLAPLSGAVSPESPSPAVWSAIEGKLAAREAAPAEERVPAMDTAAATVVRLRRSVRFWRGIAATAGALAAVLILLIAGSVLWPKLDVGQYPWGREYLAVVNRGGELPALTVRVDTREGIVTVHALGAEAPPGRSLELWYIAAGKTPKSLGLVGSSATPILVPAVLLPDGVEGAAFAVTAEPKGGSPTGSPTGPILYSGKLVEVQR
ncbi:MAG TPA: anti-sigma factor [Dongiaceae bacterium]